MIIGVNVILMMIMMIMFMIMIMTTTTTNDDDDDDGDNTLQLTNKPKLVVAAASKYTVPERIIECFNYALQ